MKRYSDSVADNTLLVSQNVTNLMNDIRAEDLLNDAVYYIDARDASASGQTIDNLGTAKELLPTTLGSSTSADSNDPKFLDHTGTNYVYMPGTGTNSLQVADSAALDITGDIDLRWYGTVDTLSVANPLIHKRDTTNNRSFVFNYASTNVLQFAWSTDGTVGTQIVANSTVSPTFATGTPIWFRVTLSVASNYEVKFYTSTNGTTWTQLGTTITGVGATSIFAGTSPVYIGWDNVNAANAVGRIFRAQVLNGIDGTKVLDVDTSVLKTGAETSFTALTGQTVTINRSTSGRKTVAVTQPCWLFGTDDYMEVNNRYMSSGTYLYLPGVFGNSASTPDSAALDITGDIDVRFKLAMDDWTPSAINDLFGKTGATADAYRLRLLTTGALRFIWVESGGTSKTVDSTVALTVTDGAVKWIRVTLDVDNGASGNDVKFYTSDDGTSWTQLGTTVTTAGVTDIRATAANLFIGSYYDGNVPSRGKFFRAQIFNGINGTKVFDADFENKITSIGQTSFVEASSNAATVTINRSGSTYRSAGITTAGYLYPGATNTFSASATDFLNFGASDSFSYITVSRHWLNENTGNKTVLSKKSEDYTNAPGYYMGYFSGGLYAVFGDGTSFQFPTSGSFTAGALVNAVGIRNRTLDNLQVYRNSVAGTAETDNLNGSLSNISTLRVGRLGDPNTQYSDMEFVSAAVFRRALTSAEITLITNYFNRRSL